MSCSLIYFSLAYALQMGLLDQAGAAVLVIEDALPIVRQRLPFRSSGNAVVMRKAIHVARPLG